MFTVKGYGWGWGIPDVIFDRGKCECQEQKHLAMEQLKYLRIVNKYCKL